MVPRPKDRCLFLSGRVWCSSYDSLPHMEKAINYVKSVTQGKRLSPHKRVVTGVDHSGCGRMSVLPRRHSNLLSGNTKLADIFISHSSIDNEVAAAIGERIRRERPSWSLFYDKDNLRAGQRWQERLREELTSCRVVLALLSRNWLGSPWCFTEAVTATFRGKDVVGIETEDLTGEDLARAPPILHERQRVRLRDGDNRAWLEMLEALDRSGLDPDDWFSIPPNVGPYPGPCRLRRERCRRVLRRKQEIAGISASSTPCAGRTGRRCW